MFLQISIRSQAQEKTTEYTSKISAIIYALSNACTIVQFGVYTTKMPQIFLGPAQASSFLNWFNLCFICHWLASFLS